MARLRITRRPALTLLVALALLAAPPAPARRRAPPA